jgi:hypothetical protein
MPQQETALAAIARIRSSGRRCCLYYDPQGRLPASG